MIKAYMTCTNCKKEKEIPREGLAIAVDLDDTGELNLCSDCQKLWEEAVEELRRTQGASFARLQKMFGVEA